MNRAARRRLKGNEMMQNGHAEIHPAGQVTVTLDPMQVQMLHQMLRSFAPNMPDSNQMRLVADLMGVLEEGQALAQAAAAEEAARLPGGLDGTHLADTPDTDKSEQKLHAVSE